MKPDLPPNIALFDSYAQVYHERYGDVSRYAQSLQHLLHQLPNSPQAILDLACGPGNLSAYIQNHRKTDHFTLLDGSPAMLQLASKQFPEAVQHCCHSTDLVGLGIVADVVLCGFLLAYLSPSDVLSTMRGIETSLKRGGILFLSVQILSNAASVVEYRDGAVTTWYHTQEDLMAILQQLDFELIYSESMEPEEAAVENEMELILICRKAH
ncbi:MAG: class I SAM-dependent methyltransferase [Bacteroidetes bacterium]|nr:class I SAM-dependent methyltransferase [Bacteroidota bacterium]